MAETERVVGSVGISAVGMGDNRAEDVVRTTSNQTANRSQNAARAVLFGVFATRCVGRHVAA
jgi:hypothetical protein